MIYSLRINFLTFMVFKIANVNSKTDVAILDSYKGLDGHSIVSDKDLFPYVVAVLRMASYLSAGAMVSDSWILTAADGLYLVRESIRQIRVRIGSVNYKNQGSVLPIKYFRIHPYFDDCKPHYDLALIKLAKPAPLSSTVYPIRMLRRMKELTTTHFIVTSWPQRSKNRLSNNSAKYDITELYQHRRFLTVQQMHPMDPKECRLQLEKFHLSESDILLCLDSSYKSSYCTKEPGAPVVLNGVLWGIVSSWKPEKCIKNSGPTFVNFIASPNITSWIDAVMKDLHWKLQRIKFNNDKNI